MNLHHRGLNGGGLKVIFSSKYSFGMSIKFKGLVISITVFVFFSYNVHSQIQSNGSGGGNWNNASTWQGGTIPDTGDDVIILGTDAVNLNGSRTIQSLTINHGGTLNQNDNRVLTLTGNLTNHGTFNSNENGNRDVILMTGAGSILDGTGIFDMGDDGTLEFQAAVTIAASANLSFTGTQATMVRIDNNVIVTNNGSVTITQDLVGANGNATWINAAHSTLTVGDDLLTTGGGRYIDCQRHRQHDKL